MTFNFLPMACVAVLVSVSFLAVPARAQQSATACDAYARNYA
jgi:hypothetical protein